MCPRRKDVTAKASELAVLSNSEFLGGSGSDGNQLIYLTLLGYSRDGKYARPFAFPELTVDGTKSPQCFSPLSLDSALESSPTEPLSLQNLRTHPRTPQSGCTLEQDPGDSHGEKRWWSCA